MKGGGVGHCREGLESILEERACAEALTRADIHAKVHE